MAVAAFAAYLIAVIGVGVWSARYSGTGVNEYFLAGRKLRRWVVALSAVVSGRSSWLVVGLTGMAYLRGVAVVWAAVGYIVVELLLFRFYAPRLRRFTGHHDNLTLSGFFETRLGDRSGVLRGVTAAVIVVFFTVYVSAQLKAGTKALDAAFGMEAWTGILLTAAIVLVYTVLGGFLAVSLTDVIQAGLMLLALVVVPAVAILDLGGMGAVLEAVGREVRGGVDPLSLGAGATLGYLGIGLGSPGNPHILVRYMSIDDPEQLRVSALIGTAWNVLMAWGAVFVGLAGRAAFPDPASLPGADREMIFPVLAEAHLHPLLFGLVIAAVFAAIMSTCDSQLLVAASCIVRDLYQRILRRGREVERGALVALSRLSVALLVGVALLLGRLSDELELQVVFWFVLLAWAGLGAAFGPTSILALYWRRTTRWGVLAGIVAGAVTAFLWRLVPWFADRVWDMYELVPAFLVGLAATVAGSLLTRPPEDVEEHFRVMGPDRR